MRRSRCVCATRAPALSNARCWRRGGPIEAAGRPGRRRWPRSVWPGRRRCWRGPRRRCRSATLAKAAAMTWGKLLAAISIVGAAAAVPVGYFAWQRHHSVKHVGSAPAVIAAKPIEPEPTQAPPALSARGARRAAGGRTSAAGPAGARPTSARPAVTLAHELSSLDAARGLLARGDATGALARLDAYGRAYPHGRLGLEAEVLRIDALDESGRERRRARTRRGVPAAPPAQRARGARPHAARRLGGEMRVSGARSVRGLACVAVAALAVTAGACGATTDSLGYNDTESKTLLPLTPPASYPNPFRDLLGQTDAAISAKLNNAFNTIFHGSPSYAIYIPVGTRSGVHRGHVPRQRDPHRGDRPRDDDLRGVQQAGRVRQALDGTPGRWSRTTAAPTPDTSPPSATRAAGTATSCLDPYGFEQFVTALIFANDRWGSTGAIDYATDALGAVPHARATRRTTTAASSAASPTCSTRPPTCRSTSPTSRRRA